MISLKKRKGNKMRNLFITVLVIYITSLSNVFAARNQSCEKFKKWNLPTKKYNTCIADLKKSGKYEKKTPGVIADINKSKSDINKKYKEFRDKQPKTLMKIFKK